MEIFRKGAVCLIALAAVLWDLREGRIPNALILAGLAVGAIFRIVCLGGWGILVFLGSAVFVMLLLGILFYFRMIGAGDVKLLVVLGGFLGIGDFLKCFFAALVSGGMIAMGLMLYRGNLMRRFWYFADYLGDYCRTGIWKPYRREEERDGEFPFTIPVLLSILCYVGGLL